MLTYLRDTVSCPWFSNSLVKFLIMNSDELTGRESEINSLKVKQNAEISSWSMRALVVWTQKH